MSLLVGHGVRVDRSAGGWGRQVRNTNNILKRGQDGKCHVAFFLAQ